MGAGASIFRRGFNSSKCKTEAKLAMARIKLLRNKREVQVRQMRRDIAMLLQSRQEDTARIRVEHVIREQNVMAANEIIELFCELIVVRLPIIAKQRDCPADLKEGISSVIYAAPRCSEIPELSRIHDIFEKKYGKDFVSAATDLRPNSGVNCMLIEKLSVRKPTGEAKLKIMKEIAKEHQIEWDATESETELLKPPEELLEGPRLFVSASSIPVKPTHPPSDVQLNKPTLRFPSFFFFFATWQPDWFSRSSPLAKFPVVSGIRSINCRGDSSMQFRDTASAARAAAESAEKAVSAAQVAAYLAKQHSHPSDHKAATFDTTAYSLNKFNRADGLQTQSLDSSIQSSVTDDSSVNELKAPGRMFNSQSLHLSNYMADRSMNTTNSDDNKILRRNSCTVRTVNSDIKFDDSDGLESEIDEEIDMETSTETRPPPMLPLHGNRFEEKNPADDKSYTGMVNSIPRVHPKLPDYEELAARFEALKQRRS
ncbi:IST1-like protein [Cocos nucifera]|uniref:IST1-like protein n=1 Tax=Cocos nucifera TaxID=13894 RepID=A0A8K0N7U3_COCNU|nr:IST1-like protein [Cocos nucifera]